MRALKRCAAVGLAWLAWQGPALTACAAAQAASAADAGLVAQISAHLAQAKGIRARFTQTQTLSAMRQPLVSTGSLLFFRARGVIWQIEAPYQATYVITDAGAGEVNPQGRRIDAAHGNGVRGAAQVAQMMRAMLGGDLSALYSQFDVRARGTPAQWQLRLTPNQPQLAQSLKGLQMSGGDYVQTVRIMLANGDVTQLDFAKSTVATQLTPAERALFGGP